MKSNTTKGRNSNPPHTTKNQVHRISENKELRKIVFKNRSGASMVLFKDIDVTNASIRVRTLKRIYSDWRGQFVIIR